MARIALIVSALALLVLGVFATVRSAEAQAPSVVAKFDPSKGELPEAVAVDRAGNLYMGMISGEIKKVTPAGVASTYAKLPSPGQGFVTGVAFDHMGNLYVGMASFSADTHGIWRVKPDGSVERFAALDPGSLPNWLAFDKWGNLLVSDSIQGQVWKIDVWGQAILWKADPLLAGDPAPGSPLPFPVGANGMAFDAAHANLYVANTDFGRIVRVPVQADGSAGSAQVFVDNRTLLGGADDIAFDSQGNLYVAVITQDRLVAISPAGVATTLLEGEPLQGPSTVAFGVGDQARDLYITNFGLLQALGIKPGAPAPALLKLAIGKSGVTVPPAPAAGPPALRVLVSQRVELLPQEPLCWNAFRATIPPGVRSPDTGYDAHALAVVYIVEGTGQTEYAGGPTRSFQAGQGLFVGENNWHAERNTGTGPATALVFWQTCQPLPPGIPGLTQLGNTGPLTGIKPGPYLVQLIEGRGKPGDQTPVQSASGPLTVYVLEGAVSAANPGGVGTLKAGDVAVVPPGTPFQATSQGDRHLAVLLTPAADPPLTLRPDVRLPSAPAALPKTGGPLPWAGPAAILAGLVLLAAGIGLRRARPERVKGGR